MSMTRYFFDLRDGRELFADEEGLELRDLRAAEVEAIRALGGMARDLEPSHLGHHLGRDMAIEVRTDDGLLFEAALTFAIKKTKH